MRTLVFLLLNLLNPQPEKKPTDQSEAAKSQSISFNFDKEPIGKLPANWVAKQTGVAKLPRVWQVVADDSAPSKPNVLALTKTESEGIVSNLLILDKPPFKDVDISVRLKAISGKVDQGGGVIWRCKDENNYYICRLNPLESNFRVYKMEQATRTQFASAKVEAQEGKWYTLRVTMTGSDIACYLDGQKLLEAKDETFPSAGTIGLWTKADAATAFDDLEVKPVESR